MKKRKSMLFYFDTYHLISGLPDDQLATLFRAVMEYGELAVHHREDLAAFTARFPNMTERTQACFLFMADTVRRDADTYEEKSANYRAAAKRRWEQQPEAAGAPDSPESRQAEAAHYIRLLKDRSRAAEEEPRP